LRGALNKKQSCVEDFPTVRLLVFPERAAIVILTVSIGVKESQGQSIKAQWSI